MQKICFNTKWNNWKDIFLQKHKDQERSQLNINTFFSPLAFHFKFVKCLSHGCSWKKFSFFIPEPAVQSSFSKYIINEVCEPSECETHFSLLVLGC